MLKFFLLPKVFLYTSISLNTCVCVCACECVQEHMYSRHIQMATLMTHLKYVCIYPIFELMDHTCVYAGMARFIYCTTGRAIQPCTCHDYTSVTPQSENLGHHKKVYV